MNTFHLILKEALHRKMNFLLSLLAAVTAVALFTFFFTTGEASRQEARVVMRDIGFNLRIIPKETDMNRFWSAGFSEQTMPEEYVYKLASQKGYSYNHLVATLHKKVNWRNKEVILTGISPEVCPPGKKRPPMIFTVKQGTFYVGAELAHSLGLRKDDVIDVFGKSLTVDKTLSETGSADDIRIYGRLHDVQEILGMEGRINEIKALECVCRTGESAEEFRDRLREQLAQVLPDAKIIELRSIAEARQKQRWMIMRYFSFIMPFVLVICAVWIGALSMMNVRDRRYEIGIVRALGYGSAKVASLFLGKSIVVGLIGATLGFGIGTGLALLYGPDIFKVTAKMIKPMYSLLVWSVIVAPAFAALASFIPAMIAVTQDPAFTLREE